MLQNRFSYLDSVKRVSGQNDTNSATSSRNDIFAAWQNSTSCRLFRTHFCCTLFDTWSFVVFRSLNVGTERDQQDGPTVSSAAQQQQLIFDSACPGPLNKDFKVRSARVEKYWRTSVTFWMETQWCFRIFYVAGIIRWVGKIRNSLIFGTLKWRHFLNF